MVEFADLRLVKGQEIIVSTTRSGKFYGKFNKLSFSGARLDAFDVKNESGKAVGAYKYFFLKDVTEVKVVGGDVSEDMSEDSEIETIVAPKLTAQQAEHIESSIRNFVHIQQADEKYFEAIADISKNFVIGISAEGCQGRIYNINLLTISTAAKIYIFDVCALDAKKTMKELKTILSSETHLKVVHDCRGLKDNFSSHFGFEIRPVFDLMLAASQFYPKEHVTKLRKCINALLDVNLGVKDDDSVIYRPFSQDTLIKVASKTAFNLAMYHKLAQRNFSCFTQPNPDKDIESFFDGLNIKSKSNSFDFQDQMSQLKAIDSSVYSSD